MYDSHKLNTKMLKLKPMLKVHVHSVMLNFELATWSLYSYILFDSSSCHNNHLYQIILKSRVQDEFNAGHKHL